MESYVHGYSEVEACRLQDQANTLADLLYAGLSFRPGCSILEAGCGVGAQTVILAARCPDARITAVDISPESIERAGEKVRNGGFLNVSLDVADIFNLPYEAETFDHVFVCFLLEHLHDPSLALTRLRYVLRNGGSVTVIEGDHGSYYCHPGSREADLAVQCLIEIQARKQGNALIGRELYPLLTKAGFRNVAVSPRMVYVDSSRPEWVEGFTKRTFIAMVEGVRDEALALGLIDDATWNRGVRDLYRTTLEDGSFCYTFFRATGVK